MRDLREISGIPISVDGLDVRFSDGLTAVKPSVRRLQEIRDVLYNQTAAGPEDLYFMYRGVVLPEHRSIAECHSIRYDITVIRPGAIGTEYIKTAGHYHAHVPGESVEYPEIYEVLSGRAHYLLQRPGEQPGTVDDVVVVEAGPGDKVVMPPGYGHVTINPGPEPLVMCNLVEATFTSNYGPYRQARGAAFYEVENGDKGVFVPNEHYGYAPAPRLVDPADLPELGLRRGVPLYTCMITEPERLAFLVRPQDFEEHLSGLLE
ncbi:MAG: glucose-6-phosphate isomerase [Firmicutes bacterium]|nr:glucose-6-phosphate isomerase [Bacillota bacterium]